MTDVKNELILVVGASGTVGSELIRLLKEDGYKTRATTSKNVRNSDEMVHMNLATGEGLSSAFDGVDRAFFLSPPGYADHYAMLSPLIQEAKRRGLKKVVLMTAMGANADESSPFRRAEVELEKSGLNYNIIRPNWFMQNFNTFWAQGILEQGKILVPAGSAKGSFIDTRDISAVAAKLLVSDEFGNQDFDLTGPKSLDHHEVAATIAQVTGRQIQYQEILPQTLKDELVKAGFPVDYVDFLVLIFGFFKEGYNARLTNSVQQILGREPGSLLKYVTDYKNTWVK